MAQGIVDSLFGVSPYQAEQQRFAQDQDYAAKLAGMNNIQQAKYGIGQGAAGLTRNVAQGMFGMVDPMQQEAQMREQNLAGVKPTAKSMRERALQIQDPRMKFQLERYAQQLDAEEQKAAEDRADAELRRAQARRAANPFAQINPKDYTSASIKEYMQSGNPADLVAVEKDDGKGTWSDPYQLGGATVQKNAKTGEIRTAVSRPPQSATDGSIKPPKNLTREARLKWELDNGLIDQATYDAAVSATPGAKLQAEKSSAARLTELGFKAVEDNIAKLYDPVKKTIKPEADALFGKYDQYRPVIAMSQETVDAAKALESLTNQVMMANLADAKDRVGQSFGSMQVQEWDKFTQQLTSLQRGLSPTAAAEAMEYVQNFIKTKRGILRAAMGTGGGAMPAAPSGAGTPPPPAKEEEWERGSDGKLRRKQ